MSGPAGARRALSRRERRRRPRGKPGRAGDTHVAAAEDLVAVGPVAGEGALARVRQQVALEARALLVRRAAVAAEEDALRAAAAAAAAAAEAAEAAAATSTDVGAGASHHGSQ